MRAEPALAKADLPLGVRVLVPDDRSSSDLEENFGITGFRVPGVAISPYARRGYVDHQTLSFDAYLRFIADDVLGGSRLDPQTDGRPDPRPTVRETVPQLGNLAADFDFSAPQQKTLLLPPRPRP